MRQISIAMQNVCILKIIKYKHEENKIDENTIYRDEREDVLLDGMLEHFASRSKLIVRVLRDDSEMRKSSVGDLRRMTTRIREAFLSIRRYCRDIR